MLFRHTRFAQPVSWQLPLLLVSCLLASEHLIGLAFWLGSVPSPSSLQVGLESPHPRHESNKNSLRGHHRRWAAEPSFRSTSVRSLGVGLQAFQYSHVYGSHIRCFDIGIHICWDSSLLQHRCRDAPTTHVQSVTCYLPGYRHRSLHYRRHYCLLLLWIIRRISSSWICRRHRQEGFIWHCPSWLDCLLHPFHSRMNPTA